MGCRANGLFIGLCVTVPLLLGCLRSLAADDSVATVGVAAVNPQGSEVGPAKATFLLTREGGKIEAPLTVTFSLSGSATPGTDYKNPGTSVTFTPYSPLAMLEIVPLRDALAEGTEIVTLHINAKAGSYSPGEEQEATVSIADATSGSTPSSANVDPRKLLPPPDRTGTLSVTVTLNGTGKWSNPKNGARSDLKFHREISYSVPLNGIYSAGSGFTDIDRREQIGAFAPPNMRRYLVWQPRDAMAPAGTPCGRGTISILDESSGLEVGDPGQPPLVPFVQTIKGGGAFPSGDRTVPERDLCLTAAAFDSQKHVLHLRIDGTDSNVKVTTTHNGFVARPYNLPLQGYDSNGAAKAKLRFFDLPIPVEATTMAGTQVIDNFNTVNGPDQANFPLQATVKWKITAQ